MANAESKKLTVDVIARIDKLEKGMAKASQAANDNMAKIERRTGQMTKKVESNLSGLGTKFAGFGASLATIGGAGIAAAFAGIAAAAADVANLAAEAKRAGIGVEVFQELKYAAEQARVGVDGLTDGIKEMQLRADEFIVTGAGGGAEAFQRLGYTADELKAKLKDPTALFGDIIERVRELDKASQIRVSDEIFGGTGGEQFVRFLDQGRNSIARLRQEAREAGAVLDSELVKSAEEIDRKFTALATTIGTRLKGAVLELVEALKKVPTAEEWAKGAPDPMAGPVNPTRRATTFDIGLPTGTASADVPLPTPRPQGIAGQGDTSNVKRAGESATTLKRGYADLAAAARARITDMQTEQAALGMTTQAAAAYRFEQDAIADAARMQITLTPQQREELASLASEYGTVTAAMVENADQQQRVNMLQQEMASIASSSITGLINGTQSWSESLANVANRLAELVLQAALLGDGPLGGLFGAASTSKGAGGLLGSLFGGFADGGYTGPGGRNQPAGVVHKGEYVFDADSVQSAGGPAALEAMRRGLKGYASGGYVGSAPSLPSIAPRGGVGSVTIAPTYSIDARGSSMTEAQFRTMLEQNNRQLRREVPGLVEQARARTPRGQRS